MAETNPHNKGKFYEKPSFPLKAKDKIHWCKIITQSLYSNNKFM